MKRIRSLFVLALVSILFNTVFYFLYPGTVHAATLTKASIRLDRMGAGVAAGANSKILVVVKPTTTDTETLLKITWPTSSAFTVDATAANHTTSTTGLPATYQGETLNAWPTIGATASSVASGDVTFSSGDLTPGTLYGFYITGGITNPATGNAGTFRVTIATQKAGPVTIDSQTVAVDVTTTNSDQVTLTATVPSTFNFALGSNTIALGTLDPSARVTGTVNATIDTNAKNGWIAWIRSEGGAATLASASTGDSISSTNTNSPVVAAIGAKGYVVDVTGSQGGSSNGSLTIATEYDGDSTTSGGVISTAYEQIAQSTGQASGDSLTLKAIVTISAVTQAASDYTDTWEVVGAGNF